ncbi:MAG TPA: TerC family protein [Candidatus Omnitrophota bacterium]|nr:TerC family protein [Candidatus Omnitrophota bacterium]
MDWTPWVLFHLFVFGMLALDLGVFHRKAHAIHFKEALAWSGVWILLALLFNGIIHFWRGEQAALEFFTGYVIEKSLSVDNIFVFLVIFTYFKIPAQYQHRVLFWGIIGALIMRAIFIAAGITLLEKFHWLIYVFGAFLILTGIKMAVSHGQEIELEKNFVLRFFKKIMPLTEKFDGQKFFTLENGKRFATPLFTALVIVEFTDVIFAVDSIPAILAITKEPFIVYTSNIFAILGLRSLYFALAGILQYFRFLHYGLSVVLVFVGIKMLISEFYKVPILASLGVIAVVILISIIASILLPSKKEEIKVC